jgi:hypothetical protein
MDQCRTATVVNTISDRVFKFPGHGVFQNVRLLQADTHQLDHLEFHILFNFPTILHSGDEAELRVH